jgi:RNA polymerase sigma factor (sigma-70 family)
MSTEDDLPTENAETPDWRAINDQLFAERNRLLELEESIVRQQLDEQASEHNTELRQCQFSLKEVNELIITTNTGLVTDYVSRFTKIATDDQRDEYKAAGMAGLVEAMKTYDASSGNFSSWAYWPVRRSVLKAVHGSEHQFLSDRDFEKRPAVQSAMAELEQSSGGLSPSVEMIAQKAGASVEQVDRILLANFTDGIDETWVRKFGAKRTVDEYADDAIPQEIEDHAWMNRMRDVLSDVPIRDLEIFIRRHMVPEPWGPQTYEDIGRLFGISREAVRQSDLRTIEAIKAKGWELPSELLNGWTDD